VEITDAQGIPVPGADNGVSFRCEGAGTIAGTDNGSPISHESFRAPAHKAYNGKCLVIMKSGKEGGKMTLTATADGLQSATLDIFVQ
jgi:beta-galactosidase